MAVMALPPPDASLVEAILREYDDGVAATRRELLGEDERLIDDWMISIEATAMLEARIPERLPGFVAFAVGAEGEVGPGARLLARCFVQPAAMAELEPEIVLEVPAAQETIPVTVAIEPWAPVLHADLRYGTVTCWVHLDDGSHAILTARHVVSQSEWPTPIAEMDNGQLARLLWHSPNCLDASVLMAHEEPDYEWLSLASPNALTPVSVLTKEGPVHRTVKLVSKTFGAFTSRVPHHFWLDEPLQPGDSGSLVLDAKGNAVGMYFAQHESPRGGRLGLCQGLQQLNHLFADRHGVQGLCAIGGNH